MNTHVLDSHEHWVVPPAIEGYCFIGYTNPIRIGDLVFNPPVDTYLWDFKNSFVCSYNNENKLLRAYASLMSRQSCGLYRKIILNRVILNDPDEKTLKNDIFMSSNIENAIVEDILKNNIFLMDLSNVDKSLKFIQKKCRSDTIVIYRLVSNPTLNRILPGNRHYSSPLPLP